jgi:hypothetical protein
MRVTIWALKWNSGKPALGGRADERLSSIWNVRVGLSDWLRKVLALAGIALVLVQGAIAGQVETAPQRAHQPRRVIEAQRFLAQRGWTGNRISGAVGLATARSNWRANTVRPQSQTAATATWTAQGPTAVLTPGSGLVTGRVSALALDPSDATGNRLYLGTTGGGVWVAQNAATGNVSNVVFSALTDSVAALSRAQDASISIGALTVQPGGTGVILAGTGDPNDALDSYYGAGILRSIDGGNSWSLISAAADHKRGFAGEGFAGFAWSTVSPQLVVAAVSDAYEGTLVNAPRPNTSYVGLYYSSDSGATWNLATITDGSGSDVQGPADSYSGTDSNPATSVVWNPVRQMFIAAVRYHGYYQSSDGITWTRIAAQPGANLTTRLCPTNPGEPGSTACPIFRGTLAVNPLTGDTFAWTVDAYNQDQGLWQDECALSGGACASQTITFAKQWSTAALETSTANGAATIENGDYTLALAAIPSGQDTLLLAGDSDLWKCSLAMACEWRNTTNTSTCKSAQVGEYQHVLAWSANNPLEIFVGNDSGIWRSEDAIGETGSACAAADATHFQNLNGGLGSLAEVESLAQDASTPSTMMIGLGVNGIAGVKNSTGTPADWPLILSGEGGPVAIDPTNSSNWYVNNGVGVSIHKCSQTAACTTDAFGSSAVVSNTDVNDDGLTMNLPAPFLVDPLDSAQVLVGTCRVWRGTADGSGWSASNAVSSILDGAASNGACSGDALIRSMAAMALPSGGEAVYVGMYGSADGGAILPGHVLSATVNPASSSSPVWQDLTLNSVTNDTLTMNSFGLDISSIFIDTHDMTGKTVYVTVEGVSSATENIKTVYRSTDGGKHWANVMSNLPGAPANSLVVDPQDANTVYIATDMGVYFTTQIATCASTSSNCWSAFGTGLPEAPVVKLATSAATALSRVLTAATYGRGVWQTSLWTAGARLTTVAASPASLTFADQVFGTTSSALTVTLTNTGSLALTPTAIAMNGDFSETDNCVNTTVDAGASCAVQVTFTPTETGSRTGEMTISANVYGGQLSVATSGTGTAAGVVSLTPATIDFGKVEVGTTSTPLQVQAGNSSGTAIPITSVAVTTPFKIASNACGTSTLAADTDCQVMVEFVPTQTGAVAGTLTFTDGAGIQTVALSGTGAAPPTDVLNPTSLSFPDTIKGQNSAEMTVSVTNTGDETLTSVAASVSGAFQLKSNSCGTQLPARSSCTLGMVFTPTLVGVQTGTLTISDLLRTQTVALSGTGLLPPEFSVSPANLSFVAQQVGTTSSFSMLTVNNTGGAAMANVGFQISGASASSYTVGTTTCGATLNAGSSCTAQVVFTPASSGGNTATLTVSSSTGGVTAVPVSLNGTGIVAAAIQATPASISFATTGVGATSSSTTVTVTNSGTVTSLDNLVLTAPASFQLVNNTCGSSLGPQTSCTAGVTFVPTSAGTQTGNLTISSSTVSSGAKVALSGMGFDFTAVASGSSSQTVVSGKAASYTLVITPLNSSAGTFTFQCGTLPSHALCTFNPTTETLSAGVTGNVAVQISTGSNSSARAVEPSGRHMLPLVCGLILLPLAWRRRRKDLLLVVLLAIMTTGVSSCAGSGGGSGSGPGGASGSGATPAGTYSIPVTVISTGVQHNVTLTLTVD